MTDRQRHGFILLLVAGLIAASVVLIATQKTILGLDLKGGVELVYQGEPTPQTPKVTQDALQRAVDIMNQRVNQLGVTEPQIQTTGNDITVDLPDVTCRQPPILHLAEAPGLVLADRVTAVPVPFDDVHRPESSSVEAHAEAPRPGEQLN